MLSLLVEEVLAQEQMDLVIMEEILHSILELLLAAAAVVTITTMPVKAEVPVAVEHMLAPVGLAPAVKVMMAVAFLLRDLAVVVDMVLLDLPEQLHPKRQVEQA